MGRYGIEYHDGYVAYYDGFGEPTYFEYDNNQEYRCPICRIDYTAKEWNDSTEQYLGVIYAYFPLHLGIFTCPHCKNHITNQHLFQNMVKPS